jgi:glycosyltransferase involved in cell wall biosynthesis
LRLLIFRRYKRKGVASRLEGCMSNSEAASIAHFTAGLGGGSGIAAQRLHLALCRAEVESRIYYGSGEATDHTMVPVFQNRSFFWRNAAALLNSWHNRRQAFGALVTSPRWVRKTPIQGIGKMPKLVNLHTVLRWLDLPSFFTSMPLGLPIVWSLHDFIPLTGGCHYPGDCEHFTQNCGNCPQQKKPNPRDDTNKFLRLKNSLYAGRNIHFVGNSDWTTAQARKSSLAKHARSFTTIHLGLDPNQYVPVDKASARRALAIPDSQFVIGFACSDFSEKRKGAELLLEALKSIPREKIFVLTFGSGQWPSSDLNIVQLGMLNSPRLQSLYYSALDVFITPSLVETFGNTAMEAMACETPVVAYATSGLVDVVADKETGLLEKEIGSVPGLVQMIQWMMDHPTERRAMGIAGRQRVIERFTDTLMARRYTDLYQQLLAADRT